MAWFALYCIRAWLGVWSRFWAFATVLFGAIFSIYCNFLLAYNITVHYSCFPSASYYYRLSKHRFLRLFLCHYMYGQYKYNTKCNKNQYASPYSYSLFPDTHTLHYPTMPFIFYSPPHPLILLHVFTVTCSISHHCCKTTYCKHQTTIACE